MKIFKETVCHKKIYIFGVWPLYVVCVCLLIVDVGFEPRELP